MRVRKFDILKVTDLHHKAYGKEIYVLRREREIDGYGCKLNEHYTCYVRNGQYTFVKRPKRKEVPHHVLHYFDDLNEKII